MPDLPPIPAGALIRQSSRACFYDLINATPLLLQVRSGTKIVTTRGVSLHLNAGDFGLIPDHQPLAMENIPTPPQKYETIAIPVSRQLFEDAYVRMAWIKRPSTAVPAKVQAMAPEAALLFNFCSKSEDLSQLPVPIAVARLTELITWFALNGAVLGELRTLRLKDRLRQIIERNPAFDWTLSHVSRVFHMSEATLRRRLANEGTSFTEVLGDTRMTKALSLLHTTAALISHVAMEVGYESPSQFSARFKERFGIRPRQVRDAPEIFARFGTEVEHLGADTLSDDR